MPLSANALEQHRNPVFIETGTYQGESVALALTKGFQLIHTMDVDPAYVQSIKLKYKDDPRIHAYLGDSPDLLIPILKQLDRPATFWLDAHPFVTPMPLFDPTFPLLRELLVIKQHLRGKGHVILMDDMRTFSKYEREILAFAATQLWPDAQHSYLPDRLTQDDVYCCVLPKT